MMVSRNYDFFHRKIKAIIHTYHSQLYFDQQQKIKITNLLFFQNTTCALKNTAGSYNINHCCVSMIEAWY
jgi:hypothetical protein